MKPPATSSGLAWDGGASKPCCEDKTRKKHEDIEPRSTRNASTGGAEVFVLQAYDGSRVNQGGRLLALLSVMRLSVPSSSSFPQRPQFDSSVICKCRSPLGPVFGIGSLELRLLCFEFGIFFVGQDLLVPKHRRSL